MADWTAADAARLVELEAEYKLHGQGHVFRFCDKLSNAEKKTFLASLERINVSSVVKIYQSLFGDDGNQTSDAKTEQEDDIQPFSRVTSQADADDATRAKWRELGYTAIAQGQVSVMLMAGGQGTRLGSSEPKGCYDIGLPSGKSIFEFELRHVQSLRRLVSIETNTPLQDVRIPVYIMTSIHTHEPTIAFFKQHGYFGLLEADVWFFQQSLLPALTKDGKIILESKSSLALSPNGNGGVYESLRVSGALADMEKRGVQFVHVFGVDNVLVKIADPEFIGFAVESKTTCSNKVVLKQNPHEKVGVMCLRNGNPSVVEYSEISTDMAESRHPDSNLLLYSAANIANHLFRRDFLESVTELPWHVAQKKIPFCNEQGDTETPSQINGIKLEMFIFDSFPLAKTSMTAFAVPRDSEFSAVKNAPGEGVKDSPVTARLMIGAYHRKLVEAAGATIVDHEGKEQETVPIIEIDPALSYDGENLEELVRGKTYTLKGNKGIVVTGEENSRL